MNSNLKFTVKGSNKEDLERGAELVGAKYFGEEAKVRYNYGVAYVAESIDESSLSDPHIRTVVAFECDVTAVLV